MQWKIHFCTIELIQSAFRKTPEVLYSIDVNSGSCSFWEFMISVIDSEMFFTCYIHESIIPSPTIRIQNRFIEVHLPSYDRSECVCFTVWYNFCIDFYSSWFILSFNESEYWLFQRSSSSFQFSGKSSLSLCSKITLIDFYFSTYFFFESIHSIFIDYFSEDAKIPVYCIWI